MASLVDELAQLRRSLSVEPLLGELDRLMRDSLHPAPDRASIDGHAPGEGEGLRRELRPCWRSRYNFSFMPDERKWIKDVLSSSEEEESGGDEESRVQFMLKVHKKCQRWRRQYHRRSDQLQDYKYISVGMFLADDPYPACRPTSSEVERLLGKAGQGGRRRTAAKAGESSSAKRPRQKPPKPDVAEGTEEDWRPKVEGVVARSSSDDQHKKLWQFIAKKEIPKAAKVMAVGRHMSLSSAKKVATMCQREVRKTAARSNKTSKDYQTRARRMVREVLVFWRKYERVEKEQRRRAEREAQEQRRHDEEMREARRQQRKLNFLITQTELYAHFMAKKLTGEEDSSQRILQKLEDTPLQREVLPGVVVNLEDPEEYDCEAMKAQALANVESAFKEQEGRRGTYDGMVHQDSDLQHSFDLNFSLANPSLSGAQEHPQPTMFNGQLKAYQLKGMNWLASLYNQGINGILADEMGLGKTIQSIALLAHLAELQHIWGPFLIVTPASTLHNWQQECCRFVPELSVLPYWGSPHERKTIRKFWSQKLLSRRKAPFHILITSYQLVVTDAKYFQRVKWQYMILDEAQAIKSSNSLRWKVLLSFSCRNRLLLTGTPIQNSMAELWALLHFIMPTLFDSHDEFSEWFSKDIESHAERKSTLDENQLTRLHMILKPFMLRRIKQDVEHEMAPKVEIEVPCPLSSLQRRLYQRLRNRITVEELLQSSTVHGGGGDTAKTSSLMNLVMQFRKVCNHPELFERLEVQSPLCLSPEHFQLPKLIYDSGLLNRTNASIWRLLVITLGLFSKEHVHRSMVEGEGGFSALRLAGISPSEVALLSTACITDSLAFMCQNLTKLTVTYLQGVWHSGAVSRAPPFLLTHSLPLSPWAVRDSPALSSLVFVSPGRATLGHSTVIVRPLKTVAMPTNEKLSLEEHACYLQQNGCLSADLCLSAKGLCNGELSPGSKGVGCASPTPCHTRGSPVGCDCPVGGCQLSCQLVDVPSLLYVSAMQVVTRHRMAVCSRRAVEVEQQELARGGGTQLRRLLQTGAVAMCDTMSPDPLWPCPLGGLNAVNPTLGWSHITLPDKHHMVSDSGKMHVMDRLLAELKEEGHRVLVYSQMTRMIDILEDYMQCKRYKYTRLDGSSRISERRDMVDDFQTNSDIFVFLLSTRAGGLGINLTAADTVIFFDSDWNPTVDQQAMDRAHRLGQTRQVTVYRLIVKGTIEERILQRAKEKSEIHRMVIQGGEFRTEGNLKPKEVVSLLLDDAEVETKMLARQVERRQVEEMRRNSRKRNRGSGMVNGDEPSSKRSTPVPTPVPTPIPTPVSHTSTPTSNVVDSEGSRGSPQPWNGGTLKGGKRGTAQRSKKARKGTNSAAAAGAMAGKRAASAHALSLYGLTPAEAAIIIAKNQARAAGGSPLQRDTPSPRLVSSPSLSTVSSAPNSPAVLLDNGQGDGR